MSKSGSCRAVRNRSEWGNQSLFKSGWHVVFNFVTSSNPAFHICTQLSFTSRTTVIKEMLWFKCIKDMRKDPRFKMLNLIIPCFDLFCSDSGRIIIGHPAFAKEWPCGFLLHIGSKIPPPSLFWTLYCKQNRDKMTQRLEKGTQLTADKH